MADNYSKYRAGRGMAAEAEYAIVEHLRDTDQAWLEAYLGVRR